MMSERQEHIEGRLEKLEDAHAFGERRGDTLSEEIAELNKRVLELARRLERLERRLESVSTEVAEITDPGVQAPPHAAGPDVSRDPL